MRFTTPSILNFCIRWRWMVNFMLRPHYPQEIYLVPKKKRRLGHPQVWSGRFVRTENLLPMPGFELRTFQHVVSRYTDCTIWAPIQDQHSAEFNYSVNVCISQISIIHNSLQATVLEIDVRTYEAQPWEAAKRIALDSPHAGNPISAQGHCRSSQRSFQKINFNFCCYWLKQEVSLILKLTEWKVRNKKYEKMVLQKESVD